jgi:hypothetical protein
MYGQHDCGTHSKGDAVKYPFALTLAGALIAGPAIADSSPASDESVRQLLELTEAHKLIDAAKVQEKIQQIQQETVQELKQAPGSS